MTKVLEGPKIRLVHCPTCQSLEEMAYSEGPAERDPLFQSAMARRHADSEGFHHVRVFDVVEKAWAVPAFRQSMIEQIRGGSPGLAAFDPTFYEVRDTFKEDAMLCFKAHSRPKEGCMDYRHAHKMLLPDTAKERKEIGLSKPGEGTSPVHYLCSYCPVERYYERKRRGD